MALKVLGDRVLVKVDEEQESKTEGGILLPDTARKKPQRGTVLGVGQGVTLDNGKVLPLDVKVGDRVVFSKYGGTEVKDDAEEYLILNADDIYAREA